MWPSADLGNFHGAIKYSKQIECVLGLYAGLQSGFPVAIDLMTGLTYARIQLIYRSMTGSLLSA